MRDEKMDHSTNEAKVLFKKMVQERVRLGMTRDQAEMLVAVLLWEPGPDASSCGESG
jgi:hypothetical protein